MNLIEFRDARDTLIDLLLRPRKGTDPIRNQEVKPEREIVPYRGFTYVKVGFSQPEVDYEIRQDIKTKIHDPVRGNGGSLALMTAELTNEDYTFSVFATKINSGLEKQLLQTVTVKTGVDTAMSIRLLQTYVDYNTQAIVVLENAQRGNNYQVFDMRDVPLSEPLDSGDGGYLEIVTTDLLTEDVQVKVVATNIKTGQTGVMDTKPTILVNPNDALVPTLKHPLVDYDGTGILELANSETSVSYQLMYVDVDDEDLADTLAANPLIGAAVIGNGATIELEADNMTEDLTVQVVANKNNGGHKILQTPVFIPVKPDPSKRLSLEEQHALPEKGVTIKVSNTQKGVLYQLRSADNKEIGWPRFHSRNYGIGKGKLEVNLAVDEFAEDSVYLPTGPLTDTTTFNVLAIKATTKATAPLTDTITVTI